MSIAQGAQPRHEIIIVRRNHDDDHDGHHSGVWKIAFADFMTAMMCFFLVMWLINAADDQTKSAVASYFNPVQLTDRNSGRKGLSDTSGGSSIDDLASQDTEQAVTRTGRDGNGNAGMARQKNDKTSPSAEASGADERLFADPYAVLAEIAADTGVMQNISPKGEGGAQKSGPATGASGGESYRDPFAPDFWSQQMATPLAEASAERAKLEGEPAKPGEKAAQAPALEPAPLEPLAGAGKAASPDAADAPARDGTPQSKGANAPSADTRKTAATIQAELARAFKGGDKAGSGVSVEATDKGVVISITDQLDFGMFEIGSAVPSRELVLAMDKIGRIVEAQKGRIAIQGHTDARPFRSATYDNWRLSTARAHAAYYMLVRSGVDEHRIEEVAGFADRQPKDPADPLAAVNRRIEILLETD